MRKRKLIAYLFFLLSLAFILTACSGGGGGEGEPSDSVAPSVTSTSPADGTAGVATDSVITATFSERMDA